ncbi:MAG: hypothetical protein ACI8Q1_000713 [Parvicella sp.]|jgi:hypothetical protein
MRIFIFAFLSAFFSTAVSQSIPIGTPALENYFRNQQLLGSFDSAFSFNYRPLVIGENGLNLPHNNFALNTYFKSPQMLLNKKAKIRLLPIDFKVAYDNVHPDSRNDGAMIRSRGLQNYISAGFYAQYGFLSLQIKPEFVWAQNRNYQGFPLKPRHWESTWQSRYVYFNRIDEPEKYGDNSYSKFAFGQSSFRLNKWGLSLGLSSENIWWGPGIRNSIMMSNNAQGFPHITFNTQRPIDIYIGKLEGQIITGRLEASGFDPPATDQVFRGSIQFVPKKDDWRYFQGVSVSYSPVWIKGLSLGFTRWVQQYWETTVDNKEYTPAFSNLFRDKEKDLFGVERAQDQAAGLFGRWVWTDAKAELYFEFAKNDAAANLRDLLVDTDHSRAITVGINKLFPTLKEDAFYQFSFEWTQTSQTESRYFRNALSWYIHSNVKHGYTNNGEVLGSALGPGGNAQYLEVSWSQNLNRIGGAVERYVHNNDFTTFAFTADFTRYWIDYNIHGFAEWQFQHFLFRGSAFYTKSLNYQWEVVFDPNSTTSPYQPGKDRDNLNLDISVTYTF